MTIRPLEGIRVLDLTIAMAGPLCTQRLGEMGAEIVKIEAPGGGDFSRHAPMAGVTRFGDAMCFTELNQNKRGLVLDLKSEGGRETLYRMAREADVLVQNFRPAAAARLGLDWETLHELNPRLVYGAISGYGAEGPMAARPGQDLLLQSYTGLTMNGGRAGDLPQASPLYMVDVAASHMLGQGLLAALVARGRTGEGQRVDVTMIGAILEMQCQEIATHLAAPVPPRRGKTPQVSVFQEPPYGIYVCSEGFLAIAQARLPLLAEVLEAPVLAELAERRPSDEDGAAITAWRDEVWNAVAARLAEGTADHWDGLLDAAGVWCMVVRDYDAFLGDPANARFTTEIDHPVGGRYRTVAPGIGFPDAPPPTLRHAPLYGADGAMVLADWGFSPAEVDALHEAGALVLAPPADAAA